MKVKEKKREICFSKLINYYNSDNRILNGLDDESHLLEKGRSSMNEVDWSHVPTKRKKPTKRKVLSDFSLLENILIGMFHLGEKRTTTTATISNYSTTSTTTITIG